MCESFIFPYWQSECIKNLLNLPDVEVTCLIQPVHFQPEFVDLSFTDRIKRKIKNGCLINSIQKYLQTKIKDYNLYLWKLYSKKDLSKHKPKCDECVDLTSFLSGAKIIKAKYSIKGKFSQYIDHESVDLIKRENLDFILRFAFGIIRGDILDVPRHGIWSYHHGDTEKYRGLPPGFWEIYNKEKVTGCILQRLTHHLDGGIILKKSFFRTDLSSYSRNRNNIYLESSSWVAQLSASLLMDNENFLKLFDKKKSSLGKIYSYPGNLQMIIFLWHNFCYLVEQRLFQLQKIKLNWKIGYANVSISDYLFSNHENTEIHWWKVPCGRFWADPFFITNNNKKYVFFENAELNSERGEITYFEMSDPSKVFTALKTNYHLSFPFIFEFKSTIYLLPEQCESNKVILYKSLDFPESWKEHHVILDGFPGVDPVIYRNGDYWYLFVGNQNDKPNDKVYIYVSKSLDGVFEKHPSSPLIKHGQARNAGAIIECNNKLFRVSQQFGGGYDYGKNVILNEILVLTPKEYAESIWFPIKAEGDWEFADGVHHVFGDKEMVVIDAKQHVKNRLTLRRALYQHFLSVMHRCFH